MNTWISTFSRRFLQIINSKSIAFAILDIIVFGKNILNYIRFNELAKHVTHSIPEKRQTQTLSHILNSFWNFSFNLPSPLFDPVLHLYFSFSLSLPKKQHHHTSCTVFNWCWIRSFSYCIFPGWTSIPMWIRCQSSRKRWNVHWYSLQRRCCSCHWKNCVI